MGDGLTPNFSKLRERLTMQEVHVRFQHPRLGGEDRKGCFIILKLWCGEMNAPPLALATCYVSAKASATACRFPDAQFAAAKTFNRNGKQVLVGPWSWATATRVGNFWTAAADREKNPEN